MRARVGAFHRREFPAGGEDCGFPPHQRIREQLRQGVSAGKAGEALAATWCHKLKHEGGAALLAELALLDCEAMCELAQAEYDKVLSYLGNHWTRMDYPTYCTRVGKSAPAPWSRPARPS